MTEQEMMKAWQIAQAAQMRNMAEDERAVFALKQAAYMQQDPGANQRLMEDLAGARNVFVGIRGGLGQQTDTKPEEPEPGIFARFWRRWKRAQAGT